MLILVLRRSFLPGVAHVTSPSPPVGRCRRAQWLPSPRGGACRTGHRGGRGRGCAGARLGAVRRGQQRGARHLERAGGPGAEGPARPTVRMLEGSGDASPGWVEGFISAVPDVAKAGRGIEPIRRTSCDAGHADGRHLVVRALCAAGMARRAPPVRSLGQGVRGGVNVARTGPAGRVARVARVARAARVARVARCGWCRCGRGGSGGRGGWSTRTPRARPCGSARRSGS